MATLATVIKPSNRPRMLTNLSTLFRVRLQHGSSDLGVDTDRMAPIIQDNRFRRSLDLDRLRFSVRHVTLDASGRESPSDLGGPRMLARLMARQALLDKRGHVALRSMDVVARRAGHVRARAKTPAALQQPHLIAVDVRDRCRLVRRRGEIVVELVTRSVGERRRFRVPRAGMAQGAVVHPPVPRETCRVENVASARIRGVGRLIPRMSSPVAMTFFTRDAEHVVAGVPRSAAGRAKRKRRAMAFQTVGDDEASEVDLAIHIAGTVDPPLDPHEIGDGQFEEEPASPVDVGLPASARPEHQVDTLGSRPPPGRVDGGLVERVVAPLHFEVDALRPRAQDVASRGKWRRSPGGRPRTIWRAAYLPPRKPPPTRASRVARQAWP